VSGANRTVVIAQARMSSTRLPAKVMADLGGKPVVDRVIERTRRAERVDDVWIATTTDPTDDVLADHLRSLDVPFVRGSLDDVLARYLMATEAAEADTVVRVTCDCPLTDPETIDAMIEAYFEPPAVDYCSNTLVRTYPLGMDTEVFSRAALESAAAEATRQLEREHVTPFLYQHPERFSLRNVQAPKWAVWPELRLTVDESADLWLAREVFAELGGDADLASIISLLRSRPDLVAINSEIGHRHVEKPASW
jgi:spore coat polysaccharide biosynthesis protein SpsF (cytidylyltransferase family)